MALTRKVAMVFTHEQTTPATTWTVNHRMGNYPIVDVFTLYNGDFVKTMPEEVTYFSADTAILTFSVPTAGYATFV